jgi:hypothetical protein
MRMVGIGWLLDMIKSLLFQDKEECHWDKQIYPNDENFSVEFFIF